MTDNTSPALQVALAYYEAWTSKDLDKAMSYISEDIVCDAPAGRLEGAESYRAFMAPFVQILKGSSMIAAFGDEQTALVMYDTETVPVKERARRGVRERRGGQDNPQQVRFRQGAVRSGAPGGPVTDVPGGTYGPCDVCRIIHRKHRTAL